MELHRYILILRRRILILVLTTLAALGAAYASTSRTPIYEAEATVYVGTRQLSAGNLGGVSNDLLSGLERVSATFAKMIPTQPIAADALSRLGVTRSAGSVAAATTAVPEPGTQLLRVRVRDRDPVMAQRLTNAVVDSFVERIETFEPGAAPEPGAVPALPAYVFEHAQLPVAPEASDLGRRLFLGGLLGALLAIGAVSVLEYLDLTVRSAVDAEKRLGLPVLGIIPAERPQSDGIVGIRRRAS